MPRGGHRERAGRKSTWKSGCSFGETKLIRVPQRIAGELLVIAHKLDAGESLDLVTKQLSLLPPNEITSDTRLTGVQLGARIGVSSAALTPILKRSAEEFASYTQERDPDGIAWARDRKKYRPLIQ